MSEFNISISSGESKRLLTGGKYCPDNIVVTAEELVEKDVNFYDYDGELLYSYTLEEAQALTELPPAPTPKRDFLVFQEWNWTLAEIKSINNMVDIGAIYTTVDGATRLVLDIWDDVVKTVTVAIKSWNSGTTIDWGDGTQTHVDEGAQTDTHTYDSTGQYIVKLILDTGGWNIDLGNASNLNVMGGGSNTFNTTLKEVYCGNNARLLVNAMRTCQHLECFTYPKNNQSQFWGAAFQTCRSLKFASIPSQFKRFSSYTFTNCSQLTVVSVPYNFEDYGYAPFNSADLTRHICPPAATVQGEQFSNVRCLKTIVEPTVMTAIPSLYLYQCFCMKQYTVRAEVTSIGASAFYNIGAKLIRFMPTTPPTVANANAFTGISAECIIEVPADSLTTYQEATNYSGIAAQMVGV